ncbi:hypothetical protein LZ30DRAFT_694946 [Colletotrichum cereale]|nr:hypothetical protein LZ30DRAFT_694946 [Colletotrichum cereale]
MTPPHYSVLGLATLNGRSRPSSSLVVGCINSAISGYSHLLAPAPLWASVCRTTAAQYETNSSIHYPGPFSGYLESASITKKPTRHQIKPKGGACWRRHSVGPTPKIKSMPAHRVSRITLMASTSTSGNNHRDSPSMQVTPYRQGTSNRDFALVSLYNTGWTLNSMPEESSGQRPTHSPTSGVATFHDWRLTAIPRCD